MKIRLIVPIVTEGLRLEEHTLAMGDSDTEVSAVLLDNGPASIESEFDEALAVPDVLKRALEAEREGCDAIVIDCMGDPGLGAAREAVSIPVLGTAQTCMHLASLMGHRFSVVTVLANLHALIERLARVYGVAGNMGPVRSVDIPVLELDKDPDALLSAFVREAIAAVKEDEADVIVFGCTGMFGMTQKMAEGMRSAGIDNVPIIDPTPSTVKVARALVSAGLTHSKLAFPNPREKVITGYEMQPGSDTPAATKRQAG